MLDRFSSAPWSTGDVLTLAALLVTCVSVGVAAGGLLVAWLTHSETRRIERAKLSMDLWQKQAAFVAEFFPRLRMLTNRIMTAEDPPGEETFRLLEEVESTILAHEPFLPEETVDSLRPAMAKVRSFLELMRLEPNPISSLEAARQSVGKAMRPRIVEELKRAGIQEQVGQFRNLLHTNALSKARADALGLGPHWLARAIQWVRARGA